jgi:TRAP-type C4-dicarboxylate transport system permease small subunit
MAHDTTDAGWLSRLERITEAVLKKIHYAGMFFILLMMLLTTAHVTGRYFLSLPIPGLVELSSYMLVSMMFLCVPYTGMKHRHITIDILAGRWSRRLQAIIHLAVYGLCLVTAGVAAWQTFIRGFYIMGQNQVSTILSIPNAPFVFVVGAGWALYCFVVLLNIAVSLGKGVTR